MYGKAIGTIVYFSLDSTYTGKVIMETPEIPDPKRT